MKAKKLIKIKSKLRIASQVYEAIISFTYLIESITKQILEFILKKYCYELLVKETYDLGSLKQSF